MTLEEITQMQAKLQKTFEPYQEFLMGVQKNIVSIHGLLDTSGFMNSIQQDANLNNIIGSIYQPVGVTKMLETFVNATSINWGFTDYSKQFVAINEGILKACEPIEISEEAIRTVMGITANIPNYYELTAGLENLSKNLASIATAIYRESEEEESSELETDFASNEELQEAIIEQNENPMGLQERVAHWADSKKKKYFIAIFILMFVWNNFVQPYFQEYIGVPVMAWTVAHVKELPEKASKFIGDLKEDIEATIIENVPYYYKVIFVDENGEVKEGYVSKRSVKIVEPVIKMEETTEE